MSEIKVVKKGDPKIVLDAMIQTRDKMVSDMADIKRRVNGVLKPMEAKVAAWDESIKRIEGLLKGH